MNKMEYDDIEKPVKPLKVKHRCGGGRIIQDRLGLYIATNPLILDDFQVDEEVYIYSKETIEDLYNQIAYYLKLNYYTFQVYSRYTQKLENKILELNKELKQQKTLFNWNEK